jgi:hypothetical protein
MFGMVYQPPFWIVRGARSSPGRRRSSWCIWHPFYFVKTKSAAGKRKHELRFHWIKMWRETISSHCKNDVSTKILRTISHLYTMIYPFRKDTHYSTFSNSHYSDWFECWRAYLNEFRTTARLCHNFAISALLCPPLRYPLWIKFVVI